MKIVVETLEAAATPWTAASSILAEGTVLFETQAPRPGKREYSILVWEPEVWLQGRAGRYQEGPSGRVVADPVRWLKEHHRVARISGEAEAVPFVGGLAGFAGYEFGWFLEDLPGEPRDSGGLDLWVGRYSRALIYDHYRGRWLAVGEEGFGDQAAEILARADESHASSDSGESMAGQGGGVVVPDAEVTQRAVSRGVEAIYEGAFFEVNYTARYSATWKGDRRALYEGLRRLAPGGFGGLVDGPGRFVASVSPEEFLRVGADGAVVTRPIKGTRPRGCDPDEDRAWAEDLVGSEKDRAENVMIVDLMRNDLTAVCEPGSVRVSELCELHSYASVHHLVSTVEGRLSPGYDAMDAFLSAFPAGSITGAPKLRVMEWIGEEESTARGPYTGSMFYWSDHGALGSNVLIRTAVLDRATLRYGSGGAVVADSDPAQEYREMMWKARPFLELLGVPWQQR